MKYFFIKSIQILVILSFISCNKTVLQDRLFGPEGIFGTEGVLPDICLDPAEPDMDGDGDVDVCDNCAIIYNPNQEDWNKDGIGDACDDFGINIGKISLDVSPRSIIPKPLVMQTVCNYPNELSFPDEAGISIVFEILAGEVETIESIAYCGANPCVPSIVVQEDGILKNTNNKYTFSQKIYGNDKSMVRIYPVINGKKIDIFDDLNINCMSDPLSIVNPTFNRRIDMLWIIDSTSDLPFGSNDVNTFVNYFKNINPFLSIDAGLLPMTLDSDDYHGYLRCDGGPSPTKTCAEEDKVLRREFDDDRNLIGDDEFGSNGAFQGIFHYVFDLESPDAPHGFSAALKAITKPLMNGPFENINDDGRGHNDSLFENNFEKPALLSLIYISERDDAMSIADFSLFKTSLFSMGGRAHILDVVFHAFVKTSETVIGSTCSAQSVVNERALGLAKDSDGVIANICDPNAFNSENMARIANKIYAPLTRFTIEGVDILSCIVRIKEPGGEINVVSPTDLHFNEQTNTINFTGNFPGPDDEILVRCIRD